MVSTVSAHCETAKSEIFVASEHKEVHQHPGCIYEVRRILLEHLAEHDRVRVREIPQLPEVRQATRLEPLIDDPSNHFGYRWRKSDPQPEGQGVGRASRIGWSPRK